MTKQQRTEEARRRLAMAGAIAVCGGALAAGMYGCNTTEGVGEDIEATGDAIDDAAEDAND